jgi:hypothetical protein
VHPKKTHVDVISREYCSDATSVCSVRGICAKMLAVALDCLEC